MRYLATFLIYIATIVRAIGWNQETSPLPTEIWILLAICGVILFSQPLITRRYPQYPRLYILIQSVTIISMLYLAPTLDFLALLLFPLCFQSVQFFPNWIGFTWIGVCVLSLAGRLLLGLEWEAGLTMLLTGAGVGFLMGSFAYLIYRTDQKRTENQRLFADLQAAYHQLKDASAQAEALAAATERHHLVRELHDSLTQTLFSMNLAVQSAQISAKENPPQAEEHLVRLQTLARSAASEVQALTGQTPLRPLNQGGLATALQQLADERLAQDGLRISLEVTGQRVFPGVVETNLFRITQEAFNNITRHAGVRQAAVHLHLESPTARLEIADEGCGFDLLVTKGGAGIGLSGMAERANEIGWELEIQSEAGRGTRITVAERPK